MRRQLWIMGVTGLLHSVGELGRMRRGQSHHWCF
jgi:hypothetical protein